MEALRGVPRAEIVAGPSRGGGLALGLARDEALAEEVELAVILVHPPGPVHVLRLVRVDELRRRGGPVGGVVVEGHVVALELFVVVGAVVVAVEAEARGDDAHRGGHGHDAGDAERADADDAEGADGDGLVLGASTARASRVTAIVNATEARSGAREREGDAKRLRDSRECGERNVRGTSSGRARNFVRRGARRRVPRAPRRGRRRPSAGRVSLLRLLERTTASVE